MAIHKRLAKLKITRKKTFTYSEKSEEKRKEYLESAAKIPIEKRVYVDECGIKEHLKREYGRAPRNVKVEDAKRGRKFHRANVVAAQVQCKDKIKKLAAECYTGSMNSVKFEKWFSNTLINSIEIGSTIIMDNANFHRKKQLSEICEKSKMKLLFLPAYSPDFNPIEKGWANMKRALRDSAPLCKLLETAIYNYWN